MHTCAKNVEDMAIILELVIADNVEARREASVTSITEVATVEDAMEDPASHTNIQLPTKKRSRTVSCPSCNANHYRKTPCRSVEDRVQSEV